MPVQKSATSSNGQQQASMSNGQPIEEATAEPVLTLDQGEKTGSIPGVAKGRSKRGPDYRLRGLDLEAQKKAVVPALPARKDQARRQHRRRVLIGWVIVITVAALVALGVRAAVVEPYSVSSRAMAPTLQVGDHIVVVKSSFLAGPIGRGNIVVFRHPTPDPCSEGGGAAQDLVQRVIGLPGQTIWSADNTIYVDGKRLKERGWFDSSSAQVGSSPIYLTTIPAGEYFVMGDNRSHSCDSRVFGSVPASAIVGKVVSIVLRGGHPYIRLF